MLFLLDAVSVSVRYAHYKIFEVDTDVYYAHSKTKWLGTAEQPPEFYLSKIKLEWKTHIPVPEQLLSDLTDQLEVYLFNRRQERERAERNRLKSL